MTTDSHHHSLLIRQYIFLSSILLLLFVFSQVSSQDYYISNTGFLAPQPDGITYNAGSLYVALNATNRIVKFDLTSQQVSYIAGTGQEGFGGENEIATESPLRAPSIAKLASDGTIYITDCSNDRIRKIVAGNVSTLVSSISLSRPFGLDIHPISGDLYISELTSRIVKLTPSSGIAEALTLNGNGYNGDQILAISANVNNPLHIHVKSNGEYYFLDYGNNAIRKVDLNGYISTIVLGAFTAIGGDPLISNEFYYGGVGQIFKYSNGSSVLIAGGGVLDVDDVDAKTVMFGQVFGITLGVSGEVYFSDYGNGRIRKLVTCSAGTSYSGYTHSCVSCFGASGAGACSGNGVCINNDVCACTVSGFSGTYCNVSVTTCFNITSDQPTTCSGHGSCVSLNNCSCLSGYDAIDCSVNISPFAMSTSISSTSVSDSSAIGIQAIYSSDVNPTYFIWACTNCIYKDSNNQLQFSNISNTAIIDGSLLSVGTYSFTVYGIYDNGPSYPARVSNVANFQITVIKSVFSSSSLEIYGLPSVVVATNASSSLNIIIPRLSLDQTLINQFLSCSNSSTTCGLLISYNAALSITKNSITSVISSYNGYTMASTNFMNNTITFTPSLNFKDSNAYSGTEMILNLELTGATNLTFSTSVPIYSSATPPQSTSANSTGGVLVDVLGIVSPSSGTTTELVSLIGSYASSSLLTVFSYDTSLSAANSTSSSDVALEIVKSVVIDPKNPTTALTAIQQATSNPEAVDSRVITELTNKINNFVATLNTNYKEERALYGFVKSKLATADTTRTTEIISNVLASGRGNQQSKGMADNLTNLLILGEIATLLTGQDQSSDVNELTKVSFTSSQLDIAVAVFTLDKEMNGTNQMIGGDNSVTMPLSQITKQYNGFSKESATTMITYDQNIYSQSNVSVLTSTVTDFKYYQNQQVVTLENLSQNIELKFKITNSTIVMEKIMEYINSTTQFNSTSNSTQSNSTLVMACKYWDESALAWSSRGCYLKGYNLTSQEILCSCSHTTMFTTFVEQNTSTIPASVKETVAAFYYGQIALGIFYFLTSIVILCLLIIFKNEQPISSRLITPYLGMIALIVESLLVYITQRAMKPLNYSPVSALRNSPLKTFISTQI
ncbi:predicted protein [Naegleria gruberi]|uniref:Predicted protein n=1 Tax=Naegleria gruberi TaxID=5762 RepID=D2VYG4_NAEGR|nr:uncharacterized protein NAEGRDRAFT_53256 [Naegleria gruberi]EFC38054.1 predicted protein [Naegleria gruberi]|eukprot:XP_002670798.1 predicted protein [Naegleria gruberi strain NEG-M]